MNATTVRVSVEASAEIAALVDKYSDDRRLMQCAVGSLGAVLSTHDRALVRTDERIDVIGEMRRQADETRRHGAESLATVVRAVERALEGIRSDREGSARMDAVSARLDCVHRELVTGHERVVHTVSDTGASLVRDVGAAIAEVVASSVRGVVSRELDGLAGQTTAETVAVIQPHVESVRASAESASASIQATVAARADAIDLKIGAVHDGVEAARTDARDLRRRMETSDTRDASSALRGRDGEARLAALLRSRLLRRDGWTVEDVHTQAHSCDFVVKRTGNADVRIECKRKKTITRGDLEKFFRDLESTGDHGLMVSLEGAVAPGHTRAFSFERVRTGAGARWAGIVVTGLCAPGDSATNADVDEFDVHQIVSAINVLQNFAQLSHAAGSGAVGGDVCHEDGDAGGEGDAGIDDGIRIAGDDLDAARDEVRGAIDLAHKTRARLKAVVTEAKAALACVDSMALQGIRAALGVRLPSEGASVAAGGAGGDARPRRGAPASMECMYCGRSFVSGFPLSRHEKELCKSRPSAGTGA